MSDCPNDPNNGYGSHNTTHTLPCLATGCVCDGLVPLPEARWVWAVLRSPRPYEDAWSAEQMRDFRAEGVAAERERLLSELRRMHDEQADRPVWHNYYLYAANVLAGKILPEGTAPSTSPLVTLAQAEAMVDAVRERWAADRDMLRDALAALVDVAGTLPDVLAGKLWHRLEDARQALAQAGGPSAPGPAP